MSYQTSIKINGKDARSVFGLEVLKINPFSPLSAIRNNYINRSYFGSIINPEKITLEGYIDKGGSGSKALHQAIETLAGEIGFYNTGFKRTFLEIIYFTSGSADSSIIFEVVYNGQFDIEHYGPGGRAMADMANIKIGLDILSAISPDGVTTRTLSITDGIGSRRNYYFEDSNCLQGANKVITNIEYTGSVTGAYADITALAMSDQFMQYPNSFYQGTQAGTSVWALGQYGNPAQNFALAGSNTLKFHRRFALPVEGSYEFTLAIRFKWNGAGAGSTPKKLFELDNSSGTKLSVWIITGISSHSINFKVNSSTLNFTTGDFSSAGWNTIVVRYKDNDTDGMAAWVYTGGDVDTDEQGDDGDVDVSDATYFYIGTNKSGTERSDCQISEVAIWKYPLSDDACVAVCNGSMPIRHDRNYEINRRLTFYLDFLIGFDALCNRHFSINTSEEIGTTGDYYIFDSERKRADMLTVASGLESDLIHISTALGDDDVPKWPAIERYNNFLLQPLNDVDITFAYNPLRRL